MLARLGHGIGYPIRAGRRQQRCRPDHRTFIPTLGVPQRGRQGAQNAPRALEPRQLRPAAVEHVAEVRVERIALAEPFFLVAPILLHGRIQARQGTHDADDVGLMRPGIAKAGRFEQAAAQHLRDIFPADGLHALFPLPPDDVEQLGLNGLAQLVLLGLIGCQQRRDKGRPVHLCDGLHEMLEEVHNSLSPDLAHARLAARVHQHFIDQDQGAEPLLLREGQQLREERLGGRGLALFILAVGMDRAESLRAGKLERKHAPGVLERTRLAVRRPNPVDSPLDVNLVEAKRHRKRLRKIRAHVLPELLHRLDVGQRGRVSKQVVERDEGMGLATAVGQLELPHRLGALPGESLRHVLDQLAQGGGCERQLEEPRGVLVDGPPSLPEGDLMQIGRELRKRELAAPQLVLEADDLVPGRWSRGGHVWPSRPP